MFYTSTRDKALKITSAEAVTKGISEEGGLFVPCEIPAVSADNARGYAVVRGGRGAGERALFVDRFVFFGDSSLYGIVFGGYGFDSRRQYSGCHF